jgi:glyceraldehyde 3-phosphate dehydrogenase
MIRVAINGFGRIGRNVFKAAEARKNLEVVAINDLTAPAILAHLLKHDSVFRTWDREVGSDEKNIIVDGKKIPVVSEKEPAKLPWAAYKVDVVIESTGRFTKRELAEAHLTAGAKRVVISAPAKDVPTFLIGVNADKMKKSDTIINNASCTTNCIAPPASVIEKTFGIKKAMMTTVHSVTAEQNLVDGLPPAGKPDLRRARSGLINMIPTTTGAAIATTEAIPTLAGLFDGMAIRVPSIDVSLSDFTFLLKKKTTVDEVNNAFRAAAKSKELAGILGVTDEPLVSSDFVGSTFSCIVDLAMTKIVDGDLLKVLAWYDNEWGYSCRLAEIVERVGMLDNGKK